MTRQPPAIRGVGRRTRQKDFPTLIGAFAEVGRRRAPRLVIVGNVPLDALAPFTQDAAVDHHFRRIENQAQ